MLPRATNFSSVQLFIENCTMAKPFDQNIPPGCFRPGFEEVDGEVIGYENLDNVLKTPGLMTRAVLEECAGRLEQRQRQPLPLPLPQRQRQRQRQSQRQQAIEYHMAQIPGPEPEKTRIHTSTTTSINTNNKTAARQPATRGCPSRLHSI